MVQSNLKKNQVPIAYKIPRTNQSYTNLLCDMTNSLLLIYLFMVQYSTFSRNQFGSMDRVSVWGLKDPGFDSSQGSMYLGCGHIPSGGCARGSWSMFLSHSCFWLSLSFPLCKKSIRYIKKRKKVRKWWSRWRPERYQWPHI